MSSETRILYLSHGGGPLPLLGDPGHAELVRFLRQIPVRIPEPEAILLISAHWESEQPRLTGAVRPSLIYDYSGFPPESYRLEYPAPGDPDLAADLCDRIKAAGLDPLIDTERGFDHGMFVPLKLMYPEANIPCVQLSLLASLDPAAHIRMGAALSALDRENLLIIGSGFSFHNMRAFFTPDKTLVSEQNEIFRHWLKQTCMDRDITETDRMQRLIDWDQAPAARFCHPREEHLLPLHVCYGIGGSAATEVHDMQVLGVTASAFLWE